MKHTPFFIALLTILFFASCKNAGVSGLPVPKDAMMVVHIDGASIASKASWDDLKKTDWFARNMEENKDSFERKLLEDPESSGINIKSDFIYFIRKQASVAYSVFEGSVKDVDAFERFLKNLHKDREIEKKDDLKYIRTGVATLVSWTNSMFTYISDESSMRDKLPMNGNMNNSQPSYISIDSLLQFSVTLRKLKSDESMDKTESYTALLKEKGDLHIWMNSSQSMSSVGRGPMTLLNASPLMQGMYSTTTVNFDNGKIVASSKQYFGEVMSKLLDKNSAQPITVEMINRIPSKNVVGVLAFSFPPETLKEIIRSSGVNPDRFLKNYNTSLDQILQATKGQFILSFSDISEKKINMDATEVFSMMMPFPFDIKLLSAISVNNQAAFEQLLGLLKMAMSEGDSTKPFPIPYKLNNEWLVTGNSSGLIDSFLAGGKNDLPFASRISGHPIAGYFDLNGIMSSFPSNPNDSALQNLSKNTWQDVVITGGEFKNGSMSFTTEINFADKSTNSLKQLGQYFAQMQSLQKKRRLDVVGKPDGMEEVKPQTN